MTEERALALLRAAERLGLQALRWLPYPDEAPEHLQIERDADECLIERDLNLVREALKETEFAVLNLAEHKGAHV